jgi:hypothetical protein
MKYVRLCRGLNDYGKLVPEESVNELIDHDQDWYQSVYYYNDAHKNIFDTKRTIKGIKDVVTNKLVFDFDNEDDPNKAKSDATTLVTRLHEKGVSSDDLQLYFSGRKGFNVIVPLTRELTPETAYALAAKYASDLDTWDSTLYDPAQLLRIAGTKHPGSGLYKFQMSLKDFNTKTLSEMRSRAAAPYEYQAESKAVTPHPDFWELPKKEAPTIAAGEYKLDLSRKPKDWRNCKWSLLQGNFKEGERDAAMMVIAATCRGLRYTREIAYDMCKGALRRSQQMHGEGGFTKQELWDKIINQIFIDDGWKGGQYSCKSDPWMHDYCKNLGEFACKDHEDEPPVVSLDDMGKQFSEYAIGFDRNVIKTGINELDANATLCASTLNGLLGQPGAGKTTVAIQYLRNTSLQNVPSMFFSLDMGLPIIYAKLVQKHTGMDFKAVMRMFREDPRTAAEIGALVKEEYKNVGFNFQSGVTIADMREAITAQQDRIGQSVKLVVIDYLECIAGPYGDATANTGFIANQLKDLANEFNACVLLLLQTQKHSTPSISDPLMTLKAVKGSSIIEQSCSTILTLWREGYSPETVAEDQYISFAIVKNRFGPLWNGDFGWNGVRGDITSLMEEEKMELADFKDRKKAAFIRKLKEEAGIRDNKRYVPGDADWGN